MSRKGRKQDGAEVLQRLGQPGNPEGSTICASRSIRGQDGGPFLSLPHSGTILAAPGMVCLGDIASPRDGPLADIWRLPAAYTPAAKQQGLPWRLGCGAYFHVYHIGIQQTCFLPVTKTILFLPFFTLLLSVCFPCTCCLRKSHPPQQS